MTTSDNPSFEPAEIVFFFFFLLTSAYCWPAAQALLDTLTAYLEQGSSLEASARMLFVHPNTVRYRLKRVTELTGYTVSEGRDGFTVWTAIVLGRLASRRAGLKFKTPYPERTLAPPGPLGSARSGGRR